MKAFSTNSDPHYIIISWLITPVLDRFVVVDVEYAKTAQDLEANKLEQIRLSLDRKSAQRFLDELKTQIHKMP